MYVYNLSLVNQEMFMFTATIPLPVYITEEFSPGFTRNPTAECFVRIPAILIKMLDWKTLHREIFEFVFVKNIDMLQAYQPLNEFPW